MILPGFPKMMPKVTGGPSLNLADAAVFDGTNDYLKKTSALSGSIPSKTFTLSIWFNRDDNSATHSLLDFNESATNQRRFIAQAGTASGGSITLFGSNTSAVSIMQTGNITTGYSIPGWHHLLVSADLSNSSLRHAYFDDASMSAPWSTYTNDNINFATSAIDVGVLGTTVNRLKGKMCHIFLDFTYRDLSVTANRRRFNDGAGAPAAGQAGLNPILYLPLVSNVPWGKNLGTGGDFIGYGGLA